MSHEYPLNVPAPHHFTFAVRDIPNVTVEQRERVLTAITMSSHSPQAC